MIVRGLIAAMLVSVSPSYVNFEIENQDVQSLYGRCKNPVGSPYYAFCLGYISGVGDDMQFLGLGTQDDPKFRAFAICATPSYGAMVQAFLDWSDKIRRKRKKIEF